MEKRNSKIMMYVLFLLAGFSLAGCATVEGIGKDVESAGEAVQDAADGD